MKAPLEKKTMYSFGTGRERMVKIHIDRIRSQSLVNPVPAPGHCHETTGVKLKDGARYSMAKKIDTFQMRLNRIAQIPGPGQYNPLDSLTGCNADGLAQSTKPRPTTVRFGTAKDRFRLPRAQAPPVGRYQANDNFNQGVFSQYHSSRKCVIGTEPGSGSILVEKYGLKAAREIPGPG